MTPELTKSQAALEQLADLTNTLEKEKVELTPEVEEYVRDHIRTVQDKLQAGEDVYESELEFIEKVKMWVTMPKEWREKYKSVDKMMKIEEMKNVTMSDIFKVNKREINIKQWLDLLHVAEAAGGKKEWIDEIFTFPGGGKIKTSWNFFISMTHCSLTMLPDELSVSGDLYLHNFRLLTRLPEGLSVDGDLYLKGCTELINLSKRLKVGEDLCLEGCTGLTELPEGLKVGVNLYLNGCTGLTKLPKGLGAGKSLYLGGCTGLTKLSEGLEVGEDLDFRGCKNLTELPNGLSVNRDLHLEGCKRLIELPEGLSVNGNLYLSKRINKQVKKDAEKLKNEGKIRGEIKY